MHAPAFPRLSRLLASFLPVLILAGCGQGDGPEPIINRPATPLPPIPAGFCDPINFEILCDPVDIVNFNGGATTVEDNPDPSSINTSERVARMQKFPDEVFGGTRLDLDGPIDFADGEAFTVKVWSARPVPLTFKLEQQNKERVLSHTGSGTWEELCADFSGDTAGAPNPSLTVIFDITVLGMADTDPTNWTFYYDDITQVESCPSGGLPANFSAITFDDMALTYTLTGFGGAEDSTVVADPDDAMNQVARVNRADAAEDFAGTTVSLGPNQAVPTIPLDAMNTEMNARVRAPGPNIPVRLKIENAANSGVSVETEALTTATDTWETLTFDFSMQAMGTAAFDPAATYNKISIFFNFGTDGATAGAQTFYFDDIDVGAGGGGGGGAGTGIVPQNVVYATDPGVTEDLAPAGLDNFGSGAVFDTMFAADADFNPAIQVTSGTDFGGAHVGFIAFTGYAGGFAATFDNFVFKVKADAANLTAWEVKFIGPSPAEDVSMTYDLTTFSGATDLGAGWLQVEVPMSDFAANVGVNNGFLVGPVGDQGAPFSYLLTDIGFTTGGGGGGGGGGPGEQTVNGDVEAGDLSGFEIFPNGGTVTADNTENNTTGGTWSIRVVAGPGNNPVIKQERRGAGTVTGGQTVTLSFDMRGTAAAGGVIFPELISEDAGGATSSGPLETIAAPTAGWTTYTYTPAAAANVSEGVTFQIGVVCGGDPSCSADVFIDNVSIVVN